MVKRPAGLQQEAADICLKSAGQGKRLVTCREDHLLFLCQEWKSTDRQLCYENRR
jgi:hypothetical protein